MGRSLALCLVLGLGPASVRLEAQIFSLSEQQEIELGREASKKVETEMPMLPAGDITDYVSRLGQSLVRYSHRSNLKYSFKVVNSPEINAFALPGGSIYVNRGLLEAADNESEVAGVLGHEISHVVARHSADQMKKAGIANLIRQTDANAHVTVYEYDGLGRRIATFLPALPGKAPFESATQYDADGNVVSTTDINGNTIHFVYRL